MCTTLEACHAIRGENTSEKVFESKNGKYKSNAAPDTGSVGAVPERSSNKKPLSNLRKS